MLIGFEEYILGLSDDDIREVVVPREADPPQRERNPGRQPDVVVPEKEIQNPPPLTNSDKVLERLLNFSIEAEVEMQEIWVVLYRHFCLIQLEAEDKAQVAS
jgi:hypothetical protein